jgi:hypothetical protein
MNVFEAFIFCCADVARTAEVQGIDESTLRRRLGNLGIGAKERELYRRAATVGRAAGRLFRAIEKQERDSGRLGAIRKGLCRDYPHLSAEDIRRLEWELAHCKKLDSRRRADRYRAERTFRDHSRTLLRL